MTRDPRNVMWAEACALLDRAEQLRRQFFEPAREGGLHARWEPPIDVFETDRELSIIVALPGVAPDAVQVQIEAGTLIIAGTRALPTRGKKASIVRLEIPYGSFERRVTLQFNRLRLAERELLNGCLLLTFAKLG
ncbi:MAG: Hsp20/alpha crystallin family protein [Methyloceanibacter sp.]